MGISEIIEWFGNLLFNKEKNEEGIWEVYKDRANSFRFRLKVRDEVLAPSGQPYSKLEDAVKDIERIKKVAATSEVKVLDA